MGDRGHAGLKEGNWNRQWYGIRRFFAYLESKAYKMQPSALLSKYRSQRHASRADKAGAPGRPRAAVCIGSKEDADTVLDPARRFMPQGVQWTCAQLRRCWAVGLHDLMMLPIERLRRFFARLPCPRAGQGRAGRGEAAALHAARGDFHAPQVPVRRGHRLITLDWQSWISRAAAR